MSVDDALDVIAERLALVVELQATRFDRSVIAAACDPRTSRNERRFVWTYLEVWREEQLAQLQAALLAPDDSIH
jgi:hypothetical protein